VSGRRTAALGIMMGSLLAASPAARATEVLPAGPVARTITGPAGMRLLAPAEHVACPARGPSVAVAARWSRTALRRPVRAVRVLLQRPGSEAVIDSVVLSPASPATTRRAVLRASACRANLDVRYELLLGRDDRAHDHTSVRFRIHGRTARESR
jgi:hypothetical protein